MRAAVVYESMYGNTRHIAEAIRDGLEYAGLATDLYPVAEVPPLDGVDLLVVGGPTHTWSMSRASTRHAAVEAAGKASSGLHLEPKAEAAGLREWLATTALDVPVAAGFDTRLSAPSFLTGRASRGIARRLRRQGARLVLPSASFFVDRHNTLVVGGETTRARAWGEALAARIVPAASVAE
jgi:hypothetical protein